MPHAARTAFKVLALAAALALGACSGKASAPPIAGGPAATCTDGTKNGAETGTDCGGAACLALGKTCANGQGCGLAADCASGYCNGSNVCADPSCTDGAKNGTETGTDCGGAACLALVSPRRCAVDQGCGTGADCTTGFCNTTTHLCATPTCADGFRNGAETDKDCGGAACVGEGKTCAKGLSCLDPTDCTSTALAPATCDPNSRVCVAVCTGNGNACPAAGTGACCSGYCNGSSQCADPCKSNGALCPGGASECCTGVCTGSPATCQPPATCTPNGLTCPTGGGACCSGTCNASNVCADPCTGNGTACGFDSDCCTGYCDATKVCATRPSCKAEGYACTSDASCCQDSGAQYCDPRTQLCAPAVSTCEASGSSCASGNECCSTACSTVTNTCTTSAFCKTPGGACGNSSECCSLSCVSGQCANTVCKATGQTCDAANPCCTGLCTGGTCQALPAPSGTSACRTLGDACTLPGDCCSTNCQGGKCTPAYLCHAPSDLCYRAEDCCSGMCSAPATQTSPPTPGRCVAPSGGCNQDGAPCAGASNCCTRLCKDLGAGVSVCQPASGCRMTGDFCDRTESCCGGSEDASSTTGYGVFCDSKGTSPGPSQYDTSTKDDRTCTNGQSCNPPGNICGGSGAVPASQNCCDGKKEVCKQDANGIYRCFGGAHVPGCTTGYDGNDPACCIPTNVGATPGGVCQFRDQCCNFAPCVPDDQGVLRCTVSACKPLDATCAGADDSSCCAGTVCTYDNGSGTSSCRVPGSCTPNGGACTFSNQCCSSTCNEGTCAAPCVGASGSCTADADCCNGLGCTIPGGATSGTCTSASTCAPTAGACSLGSDCCNAPTEQCVAGKCAVPPSCTPQLQSCSAPTSSSGCCSGLSCVGPEGAECTSGGLGCVCDSCAPSGGDCSAPGATCCFGLVCNAGSCQSCAMVSGSCTSQAGCCTGLTCADPATGDLCSGGSCTCESCTPKGASCTFSGQCCGSGGVLWCTSDGANECAAGDPACTCELSGG